MDVNSLNTQLTERSRIRVGVCDAIKAEGKEIDGKMYVPVSAVLGLLHDPSGNSGNDTSKEKHAAH